MAHPGPNVPHRTPRKRALEVGTASAGFTSAVPYDSRHGVPTSLPSAAPYKPAKMTGGSGAKSVQQAGTPFKLGGSNT